jgi:hypothetical protein
MQRQAASEAIIVRLRSHSIRVAAAAVVAGTLALSIPFGIAQDASPAQPNPAAAMPNPDQPASPAPQTPPVRDNPGLIQEIGRLFERGAATVRGQFDATKKPIDANNQNIPTTKTIGDAALEVGKTAAGVVVTPLTARIVSGHERCGVAPNGAPDCLTAAQQLCKRHGYNTGKSVDFTSAEQCSPTVLLTGRDNAPACTTVTFISRAMCQ